ncbi:MAG: nucleotidyltransferase domain-containing protein [Bacteroidales bacterium]|nr:nucleotidyltransferase domain-containing protein [Bacteroidales bacterium]MCB8999532.1 nucleotidyltransferase domain-containing protein [Bacteroidales bacterium]MCB9012953.1 nucleotidyltransferase domain-containing protein [Bacteroidales bacterium]
MDDKAQILEYIKNIVQKHIPGSEARLFGSRARADSGIDSDYDILIITEKLLSPKDKFPLKSSIRKELLKSGIRSDILIQSKREIAIKKTLPGHIIRNILKEAILL